MLEGEADCGCVVLGAYGTLWVRDSAIHRSLRLIHPPWKLMTRKVTDCGTINELGGRRVLTGSEEFHQLLQIFHVFYWTQTFLNVFTAAHHLFVSQSMNPLYAVRSYSLNIHFNIIPQTPTSSKWSLSFRVPHQDSVCISLLGHACHIPVPSQPPWFYHLTITSTNHEAPNYVIFPVFSPFHLDLSPVLNHPQSIFIP
jgi:hypothetical protein